MKTVQDVEPDPRGAKGRTFHFFEVKCQAVIYSRSPGTCSRHTCCKVLFLRVCFENGHWFWKKDLTWSSLLELVSYSTSGESRFQHPGWANVITNISRLPEEEVLYRDKPASKSWETDDVHTEAEECLLYKRSGAEA